MMQGHCTHMRAHTAQHKLPLNIAWKTAWKSPHRFILNTHARKHTHVCTSTPARTCAGLTHSLAPYFNLILKEFLRMSSFSRSASDKDRGTRTYIHLYTHIHTHTGIVPPVHMSAFEQCVLGSHYKPCKCSRQISKREETNREERERGEINMNCKSNFPKKSEWNFSKAEHLRNSGYFYNELWMSDIEWKLNGIFNLHFEFRRIDPSWCVLQSPYTSPVSGRMQENKKDKMMGKKTAVEENERKTNSTL